jgi:hypothetical protein
VPAAASTAAANDRLAALAAEVTAAWHKFGRAIERDGVHVSEATEDAGAAFEDALDALCVTPARSLADLVVKARVCRLTDDDRYVLKSIVDDLLAIEGARS